MDTPAYVLESLERIWAIKSGRLNYSKFVHLYIEQMVIRNRQTGKDFLKHLKCKNAQEVYEELKNKYINK